MTSIVGILCQDGVVVGADSSVTIAPVAGHSLIEQPFEKIDIIENHVILVGTGQVGLGQRFRAVVQKAWPKKFKENDALTIGKILAGETIKDFMETNVHQQSYGALVAFPCFGKPYLTEFGLQDFQPEMKTEKLWFTSMGSAEHITDTFLAFLREVFWPTGLPNVNEGIFAAKWTLDHAVAINAGGVNGPVKIAVLEKTSEKYQARILVDDELQEHAQAIKDAKTALAQFRNKYRSVNQDEVPSVPQPILDSGSSSSGDGSETQNKKYE